MRLLFEIDTKDYKSTKNPYIRHTARAIIIKDGKVALSHSGKYDYYEFPGGGIKRGEKRIETLIREVREEGGLLVKADSVRPYGYVHRIQNYTRGIKDVFIQDSFYYFCSVEDERVETNLDDYEIEEGYTLEFLEPAEAIRVNRTSDHGPKDKNMIERETKVLELLVKEGYLA